MLPSKIVPAMNETPLDPVLSDLKACEQMSLVIWPQSTQHGMMGQA